MNNARNLDKDARASLDKSVVDETWRYLGSMSGVVKTQCPSCEDTDTFDLRGDVYLHPKKPLVAIVYIDKTELKYLPDIDPVLAGAMERMCIALVQVALLEDEMARRAGA